MIFTSLLQVAPAKRLCGHPCAALGSRATAVRRCQGLAILETTIGNSNPLLYKYVVPTTVLEWIRNMVANRLAINAASWDGVSATCPRGEELWRQGLTALRGTCTPRSTAT
jgi:hypothetical protein